MTMSLKSFAALLPRGKRAAFLKKGVKNSGIFVKFVVAELPKVYHGLLNFL